MMSSANAATQTQANNAATALEMTVEFLDEDYYKLMMVKNRKSEDMNEELF